MFKLNDKVIYPGHGAALVEELVEKSLSGQIIQFFKLNFLCKDMTILIPINNLENSGVRFPGSQEIIKLAIEEVHKVSGKKLVCFDFTPSGWNRRNKEYQLKIQRGNIIEIAQVYRDLMIVSQQKELSFGEKKLLEVAEELLVQEIQLVMNKDRDFIIQELQEPLKEYFFHHVLGSQQVSSSAA